MVNNTKVLGRHNNLMIHTKITAFITFRTLHYFLRNTYRAVFFFLVPFFMLPLQLEAQTPDWPFNNAANWGGTGLMETPTARILEDGEIRAGFTHADPYRWWVVGMGPFPGLEVDFRYTELLNIFSGAQSFGTYKDKCLDFKYQVLPESKIWPAVAFGFHDIQGQVKLFESKYLVFSRQIYPFDFTFGIGSGRLKGKTTMPFSDSISPFGGIEFSLHDRINLMA